MIFNLIIILFIAVVAFNIGILPFALSRKTVPKNLFLTVLVGIAILGVFSQLLLLGGRIDLFSLAVVILSAIVIRWRYRALVQTDIKQSLTAFINFPKITLLSFFVCSLILSFQAAQVTKINDLGMYYLQTLKWMQSYGLVKGLANLHPAYGLYSSWHSLNALFSFEELIIKLWPLSTLKFIGLNAFLVIMALGYLLVEIQTNFSLTILAFTILFLPIGFLYLTAPSPDLPAIFYTFLMIYLALSGKEFNWEIFMMAAFTFWLKPPAFMAILLGMISYKNLWKNFLIQRHNFKIGDKMIRITTLFFLPSLLFLGGFYKNYVISGHLLYPMANQSIPLLDKLSTSPIWQVPEDWNKAYRTGIINWGNVDDFSKEVVKDTINKQSLLHQVIKWLNRSGYKGWMNKWIALTWICGLLLFFRKAWVLINKKGREEVNVVIFIGLNLLILFIEWLLLRQYRLLLPSTLCLASVCFHGITFDFTIKHQLLIPGLITVLFMILCFFPFHLLKNTSRNKQVTEFGNTNFSYLVFPFNQYGDTTLFKTYCWDKPLPCQSESHKLFLHQFGYQIVPLGTKTSDGFKLNSVKRENNF